MHQSYPYISWPSISSGTNLNPVTKELVDLAYKYLEKEIKKGNLDAIRLVIELSKQSSNYYWISDIASNDLTVDSVVFTTTDNVTAQLSK